MTSFLVTGALLLGGAVVDPASAVTTDQPQVVTYLDPAAAVRTQSSVYAGGRWYAAQALAGAPGEPEDLVVSRMSGTGALVDSMRLTAAGHGSQIAVQVDGWKRWVWVGWPDAGGSVLARVRYQPGVTATLADAEQFPQVAVPGQITVALDPAGRLAVREVVDGDERFELRDVDDVLAGVDQPLGSVATGNLLAPYVRGFQYQGHASSQGYLYRLAGMTDTRVTINRYAWSTGQLVDSRDVSRVLPTTANREPEGMTTHETASGRSMVMFGFVTARRVGRYPVFGVGDPRTGVCRPESHTYVRARHGAHPRMTAVVRRVDCAHWTVSVKVRRGHLLRGRVVQVRGPGGRLLAGRYSRAGWTRPVTVGDLASATVSVRGRGLPLTRVGVRFVVRAR